MRYNLTQLYLLILLPFFTLAKQPLPETLQDWVPWVLEGNEQIQCPFINNSDYAYPQNHVCAWGGSLTLDAATNGGTFSQHWQVLSSSLVPLPGDNFSWPQNVIVNQKVMPVIERNNLPLLQLEAGEYQVQGQFIWQQIPQNINLPEQTALVKLSINQQAVAFPKIEGHELWLQNSQVVQQNDDNIELSVARKVTDDDHLQLDTYIRLSVSGKIREVALGTVLPKGFSLIGIDSKLPAFLDNEGMLYVKLRPGEWQILVSAFASPTNMNWKRPEVTHFWPTDEIWVFAANETLRTGKLEGVSPIDSSQATMPDEWYELPAYLVSAEDEIQFDITHRGMPLSLENNLHLDRTLWLAFDQQNLNFVDKLSGNMVKDWRISMTAPFALESADDSDGAVLITTVDNNERGIETRYPQVNIEARGKVSANSILPVSGYQHDLENVSLTLHLPPGTDVFAVFGADTVSNAWWNNWSIWSSFIVLLATIAAARLLSITAGIFTALVLLCIYQQGGAPVVVMLNLLVAMAVQKHLHFESLKSLVNIYWGLSASLALGAILYFSAVQLRTVIYPQLEAHYSNEVYGFYAADSGNVRNLMSPVSSQYEEAEVEEIVVTGSRSKEKDLFVERYQSDALMQAGSGIPDWHWKSVVINWNSPVAAGQQFDLWLLHKTANRVFKSVGLLLLLGWLYLLLSPSIKSVVNRLPKQSAAALVLLGLLLPSYSPTLQATEFPDQILLEQLRSRVLKAPQCAPQCATISQLQISTKARNLELHFTLQVQSDTAIALPRSEFWRPEKLQLNGKDLNTLYMKEGWIYVPVNKGVLQLNVIGKLSGADEIQLEFKQTPKNITVANIQDWQLIGLQNNVMQGNALTFLSTQTEQQDQSQNISRYSPLPLVKVTREISFDQVWRIVTEVERVAPASGSITVNVPTIDGELITSSGMTLDQGMVSITIPAGEDSVQWRSSLQRASQLTLHASATLPLVEHWSLVVSPAWHASIEGVPVILQAQSNDDYYAFNFYPYPDETLQVALTRPQPVAGQVLAIDRVDLNIEQGTRTSTLHLDMDYRSTRGGEHAIELPADFELKELMIDNKIVNLQSAVNQLTLPVYPGLHNVKIIMRSNTEQGSLFSSPTFNLHAAVSNITTTINVSRQRWVLWASGPTLGPAVLYWGELLTFVLLALMLSRLTFSPLSPVSWIILGLGLSLNNWTVLMMIVLWFGAISASQYRSNKLSVSQYNTIQAGLYIWSVITVISLIAVVPMSLLGSPSMGIDGNNSTDYYLKWFADQSQGMLPEISVFSVPIWIYKALMLVWVIWLSFALINWIKWVWKKLGEQGYWKKASVIQTPNK
jgi:hypothetical protein